MINQNKLSKYECITILTKKEEEKEETKEKALSQIKEKTYTLLASKFDFDLSKLSEAKKRVYLADVTKDHLDLLFLDMKKLPIEISPCSDCIEIKKNKEKDSYVLPMTQNKVLVLVKYPSNNFYKFFGVFKQKVYADNLVELEQFNPTYYSDKKLEKFIY